MQNAERLEAFSMLASLAPDSRRRVAAAMGERLLETGETLFREGDRDNQTHFLLSGSLALRAGDDQAPLTLRAGGDAARHPIARLKPRRYTAVAQEPTRVASIDEDKLEDLLTVDQTAAYEVTEFEGEDPDWMFQLLRAPSFQKVPSSRMAELFSCLESRPARAGEMVIRQGELGDYYYLIRQGRARITRRGASGKDVILADIGPGEGFGEEALLSGDPRNATVTMLEDGMLMRLAQTDFDRLLKRPLVKWLAPTEVAAKIQEGALLVDVRLESEFLDGSLEGAINVPLYLLRLKAKTLNPRRPLILFCQTERRSCTAAFLLTQRGFDVHVLRGGLNG